MFYLIQMLQRCARLWPSIGSRNGRLGRPHVPGPRRMVDLGSWAAVITGGLCGGFIYDSLIFTGGESPVNYPPRRRKRAALIKEKNIRRKLRFRKGKIQDLEKAVQRTEG